MVRHVTVTSVSSNPSAPRPERHPRPPAQGDSTFAFWGPVPRELQKTRQGSQTAAACPVKPSSRQNPAESTPPIDLRSARPAPEKRLYRKQHVPKPDPRRYAPAAW